MYLMLNIKKLKINNNPVGNIRFLLDICKPVIISKEKLKILGNNINPHRIINIRIKIAVTDNI